MQHHCLAAQQLFSHFLVPLPHGPIGNSFLCPMAPLATRSFAPWPHWQLVPLPHGPSGNSFLCPMAPVATLYNYCCRCSPTSMLPCLLHTRSALHEKSSKRPEAHQLLGDLAVRQQEPNFLSNWLKDLIPVSRGHPQLAELLRMRMRNMLLKPGGLAVSVCMMSGIARWCMQV
jgi:hypothetical protein